jgi:hypothetical protein
VKRPAITTADAILHAICSPCSPLVTSDVPGKMNIADALVSIAMELGRVADCMEADRKPKKGRKP